MFLYRVTQMVSIPADTVVYLSPSWAEYYAHKLHARVNPNVSKPNEWSVISAITAVRNLEIGFQKEPTALLSCLEPLPLPSTQEEAAGVTPRAEIKAPDAEVTSVSALERCILETLQTTGQVTVPTIEQQAPTLSRRSIQKVFQRLVTNKTLMATRTVIYTAGLSSAR